MLTAAVVKGTTSLILLSQIAHASEHTRSFSSRSLNHHHHRRQSIPTDLPGNWTSVGCYTDNGGARTLSGDAYTSGTAMTVESCISFCDNKKWVYAGLEYGQECYCGNGFLNGGKNATATDCNMACTGDSKEFCGAGDRLNVFWSGATPPPPPQTVPSVGDWDSLGCYSDEGPRTLATGMGVTGPMSIEACTSACFNAGYPLAGTEFARECYCGTAFTGNGAPTPLADCNMVCEGNSSEFCGGPGRLNVYNYTGTDLPPITNPGGGGNPGGGNTGEPVYHVTEGLPDTWQYVGCYVDNKNGRILPLGLGGSDTNTIETCVAACIDKGYNVTGTEYSTECYCGNAILNGGELATADTECNMGCAGNTTEACGGPGRMSIYSISPNVTTYPVPVAQEDNLPGQWEYQGCYTDSNEGRVFPYQVLFPANASASNCLNQCAEYGYPAAGLEFGNECWCGDIADVAAADSQKADEASCSFGCSGDPYHVCGGSQKLQLYYWGGPTGKIDTWHTPAVTGWYEYLIPGVVIPLVSTVGINGKVSFLEKTGTSTFANSTGGYELDLSLAHNFNLAYREMHPKTDVFCAASIILPDRAGRQINVGGWSLESTFGIRFYAPDGSPGVNGTNDWEEDKEALVMQRGRWYPTVMLMQNSSILVVGGQTGSNGPPQPTLEILPKPAGTGETWKHLDWLDTPNQDVQDLYPFMFVLRNGDIFVAYWHQARILDKKTLDTVKVLPDSPSSVTGYLGGRTYPLEGSAVLLPQHAPYTDPLTVLICGGSNPGAGEAIDNCISTQPEVANPTWLLERMPSRRVMSCFAALPDGTYLIVNGAHQGVAGFGLATDPNLQAVLYDPSQPAHQRMSILNSTTIARLYHSEAVLLMDGRVLITGSDPEDNTHPQELRVEVYVPPYLATGKKQPTFNITETDWKFGGTYTITNVKLFQGKTSGMRVSLMAAASSTHGNTMGGRTIFPAFTCVGTTCTIQAPPLSACPPSWHMLFILDGPTPSHATWVRIGGDPAGLGNWPQLPGFNPPGPGKLVPHA